MAQKLSKKYMPKPWMRPLPTTSLFTYEDMAQPHSTKYMATARLGLLLLSFACVGSYYGWFATAFVTCLASTMTYNWVRWFNSVVEAYTKETRKTTKEAYRELYRDYKAQFQGYFRIGEITADLLSRLIGTERTPKLENKR